MSNARDTAKMATDEVVAFAIFRFPCAVMADSMAVTIPSIDIAYSPKPNSVASLIRSAER